MTSENGRSDHPAGRVTTQLMVGVFVMHGRVRAPTSEAARIEP